MTIFSMLVRWVLALGGYIGWIFFVSSKIHPSINGEWYFVILGWCSFGVMLLIIWLPMWFFLLWSLGLWSEPWKEAIERLGRKIEAMFKAK